MIPFLRDWILGIVVVSLVVSAAGALAGDGPMRRMVRLIGAMVFLLTVLLPLKRDGEALLRQAYRDWDANFRSEIAQVQTAGTRQYEYAVQDALQEQIAVWAAEQGIVCSVQVDLEFRDGIPVPQSCLILAGALSNEQTVALYEQTRQMLGTDQITIQKE